MGKVTSETISLKSTPAPGTPDEPLTSTVTFRVHYIKHLTDTAFILRFDRNNLEFTPGQYITLGPAGEKQTREYSIYSANNVNYLEVLVKEVDEGIISKKLKQLKPGDTLNVDGPYGFFMLNKLHMQLRNYLFIATGTGIAPFHSMVNSFPNLNYRLIHGIRYGKEQYESDSYQTGRYISCTSRDNKGNFQGRVTDYLSKNNFDSNTLVYLCGNYKMIHSVYDLLTSRGLSPDNIRTEVYF